jgi:hypothetical protein
MRLLQSCFTRTVVTSGVFAQRWPEEKYSSYLHSIWSEALPKQRYTKMLAEWVMLLDQWMRLLQSCFKRTVVTGGLFAQRWPEEELMVTCIQFGVRHFQNKGTLKWEQSGHGRGSADINFCTTDAVKAGRAADQNNSWERRPVRTISNPTRWK